MKEEHLRTLDTIAETILRQITLDCIDEVNNVVSLGYKGKCFKLPLFSVAKEYTDSYKFLNTLLVQDLLGVEAYLGHSNELNFLKEECKGMRVEDAINYYKQCEEAYFQLLRVFRIIEIEIFIFYFKG